jgi:chemotaxis protein methyltransferase CheR
MTHAPTRMEWSEQLACGVSDWVARHMGLHFPADRHDELQRGLEQAARIEGFDNAAAYVCRLMESPPTPAQIEVLAGELTIGETYFFREPSAFDALRDSILPSLIQERRPAGRHLKFWSAACCTGEEPYSLAIELRRALPDWRDWNLDLRGTDINPSFLARARAGCFGDWSFRGVDAGDQERNFIKRTPRSFEILPDIRGMVSFSQLNLVEPAYPPTFEEGGFDVILCRNVLLYFDQECQLRVIRHLHALLREGAWLIPGLAEGSNLLNEAFTQVPIGGAVFFQKPNRPARAHVGAPLTPARTEGVPPPLAHRLSPRAGQVPTSAQPLAPRSPCAIETPRACTGRKTDSNVAPDAAGPGPEELVVAAERLHGEGKTPEALARLKVAQPDRLGDRGCLLMARILADKGRLTEARGWAEQAAAAGKTNARAHFVHAIILQELSEWPQAEAAMNRALFLEPDLVMGRVAAAQIASKLDKPNAASKHYSIALSLLQKLPPQAPVPESDGMTAGLLTQWVERSCSPTTT